MKFNINTWILALALVGAPSVPMAESADAICLAKNIYYEARGEGIKGMQAVAQVTLNRTKSERFPSTICEVVYQKYQFSWTANKNKAPKGNVWEVAKWIARDTLDGNGHIKNFDALYFHNTSVKPNWKLRKVATIGRHIFYL